MWQPKEASCSKQCRSRVAMLLLLKLVRSLRDSAFSAVQPKDYTTSENPSYQYQLYFLWSNLHVRAAFRKSLIWSRSRERNRAVLFRHLVQVLNELRARLGLNTFQLRPHCGESGAANIGS